MVYYMCPSPRRPGHGHLLGTLHTGATAPPPPPRTPLTLQMGGSYQTALDIPGGCSLSGPVPGAARGAARSLDAQLARMHALVRPLFRHFLGRGSGAGGVERAAGGGSEGGTPDGAGEESDVQCTGLGGGGAPRGGADVVAGGWGLALSGSDSDDDSRAG